MPQPIKDITINYQDGTTLQLTYDQYLIEFQKWLEELYDRSTSNSRVVGEAASQPRSGR